MSLGQRLYDLRKTTGLSQEKAAEQLGVTRQTVSKWETDQTTPDFDKIILSAIFIMLLPLSFSAKKKRTITAII